MNYLDLAQPWLEWESKLIAEEQHNCYINGQNDALTGQKPQEPDNQSYMMGWEETSKKIAKGQIQLEVIDSNYSENTADEEF